MVTNFEIESAFELLGKLMELHGENPFKAKSYLSASYNISKVNGELSEMTVEEINAIPTIGVSIKQKIQSLLSTGHIKQLDELLDKTPAGVVEMMSIKGIGPKKVSTIWKELEIESIDELKYACLENRLSLLKGFGEKTQKTVLENIQFYLKHKNKFRFGEVEEESLLMLQLLKKYFTDEEISFTGEFRRYCEVLDKIDLLTTAPFDEVMEMLSESPFEQLEEVENTIHAKTTAGTLFQISFSEKSNFFKNLFITSGNEVHVESLKKRISDFDSKHFSSEEEIYQSANLSFILPELREGINELELAAENKLPQLIDPNEIKGVVHAHSKWSDGNNTIEEMARYSMKFGYEYLCMSDHSKSATYASGLSVERVLQQHDEIDKLNKKLSPFRIFKGIESDMLGDGSLDYDDDILSRFDFVIASIHQNFKMSEEKATERLIHAIENPYTTILGHPTGRLLLSRIGYPINHKAVIEAAAKNNVIIEMNAHPWRLDLDWRWIQFAISLGVEISINPDAHNLNGIHDIHYGTLAARKGMLTQKMTFNSRNVSEMEEYFTIRKSKIGSMAAKQ